MAINFGGARLLAATLVLAIPAVGAATTPAPASASSKSAAERLAAASARCATRWYGPRIVARSCIDDRGQEGPVGRPRCERHSAGPRGVMLAFGCADRSR